MADAVPRLAAGGLVAIRDAFEPGFAERMYRSLDSVTAWRLHENCAEKFCYHHHNLYHADQFPADMDGGREWPRQETRSGKDPTESAREVRKY